MRSIEFTIAPEPHVYAAGCRKGLYGGIAVVVLGVIAVGIMIVLVSLPAQNADEILGLLDVSLLTSSGGHLSLLSLRLLGEEVQQKGEAGERAREEARQHVHTHARKLLNVNGRLGQAPALLVYVLSYYVRSIQICENISLPAEDGGTAAQPTTSNCLTLYSGDERPDDNTYGYDNALTESVTGRFINLADISSRSNLKRIVALRKADLHAYHWGVVSWYRPVLVKASVIMTASPPNQTLYTKLRMAPNINTSSKCDIFTTQVSNLTISPAEQSAVLSPHSVSIFSFLRPFVFDGKDPRRDNERNDPDLRLALAFNLDGIITASSITSPCGGMVS